MAERGSSGVPAVSLPVALHLAGRVAVVVGGGRVAGHKVAALLESGARVHVVSPGLAPVLQEYLQQGAITVELRAYHVGDTSAAFLVIAATGDPSVDAAVAREAAEKGQLVCVCSDGPMGNVSLAAYVRRGSLTIAVASSGASPALVRRVRREIAARVGPEYGALAELLGELRRQVKAMGSVSPSRRRALFTRVVKSEALALLARGEYAAAEALVARLMAEAAATSGKADTSGQGSQG